MKCLADGSCLLMPTLLMLLWVPAAGADEPTAPLAVARQFHDHLQAGKVDAAVNLLVVFGDKPDAMAQRRLTRLSDQMVAKQWDFVLLDTREDADCAVVVMNENLKNGRLAT